MLKKNYFLILAFIMTLTLVAACTSNEANEPNDASQANEVNESDAATAETEASENDDPEEPLYDLENDGVDEAALQELLLQFPAEQVERIVTTSVPLTEMLHILGITPVGVPTSTNPIPADFDDIERIGSPMTPDLEIMTSLEPELILGAESLRSTLEKNLESIDLEAVYLPTDSFDDLKVSFKTLGTYFNKTEAMNEKLASILEKENELAALVQGKELPSVMLMIGTSDSFMVMSEGSYLGGLVAKVGADNIATSVLEVEATYSAINLEDVVVADPDIIFVLASGDHGASEKMFQEEVSKNEAWKKLSAYQNDTIHILDYSVFGVTSIHNVEQALTQIADYFFE